MCSGGLTVSFTGVIDTCEVFVATALEGTLGVVAHVGTDSKLATFILICTRRAEKRRKEHECTVYNTCASV